METDLEIRFRLPPGLHKKWSAAAALRGLTLKAFVAATVSNELIRTGELVCSEKVPSNLNENPAAAPRARATPVIDYEALARDWSDEDDDD